MPNLLENILRATAPIRKAVRPIIPAVPFVGDAINFLDEYGRGRTAGLKPQAATGRAAAKAGAGFASSLLPPADVLTISPWVLRLRAETQKKLEREVPGIRTAATAPGTMTGTSMFINPAGVSPQAFERTAKFFDKLNPEAWALQVADKLNPELQEVQLSLDPEERAEQIKKELLMRAAQAKQ